jgi:di/tricarboxylate transporter
MDQFGLELYGKVPQKLEELEPDNVKLYEAVVSPGSILESRSPAYLRRRSGYTLHLLAVAREGEPIRKRIKDVVFRSGDVLLMQGDQESTPDTLAELKLLPLPERGLKLGKPRKMWLALGIFALAILLSALGYVSLPVAFIAAIGAYVMTGILPTRELYSYIDWPIIVLLGAMIPVGQALQATGSTDLIANAIVTVTASLPIWAMLGLIMVVTMTLSDLINNAATALIMAPIAAAIATTLGHSVDPYLMTVAVGASCAFLTPIGHQSNTLVMGPAGYHFSDYWRMGLPLEIMILIVSVPLIMWMWPLVPV